MNELDKLKREYNHNLTRYYNGCRYLNSHKEDMNKWLPELLRIQDKMNELLEEIMKQQKVSRKEILKGFEL